MKQLLKRPKVIKFEAEIKENFSLTSSVKHIILNRPNNFEFIPGQFITLIVNKNNEEVRRNYSITSKIDDENLELCIKILDNGLITPIINTWKKGDKVNAIGPLGHFILNEKSMKKDIIFISTGTGIGPFRSMIDFLLKNNFHNKLILITGYKNEKEILYDNEFKELKAKYENFSYYVALSRSEPQEKIYVQDIVSGFINLEVDYYICGLKDMIDSVRDLLLEKGVSKENIFFERYD